MKIIKNKFFICISLLFTGVSGYCEPPAPTQRTPTPPPAVPIDQNIIHLALVGVIFGTYIIYKQNKKRPI